MITCPAGTRLADRLLSRAAGSRLVGVCVAALLGMATPVQAQCELGRLLDPALQPNPNFGFDVAVEGDRVVVGSSSGLFGGEPCYVFERQADGWTASPVALPPDNLTTTYGHSVAISGDTIVVSGQDVSDPDPRGYVFERVGGTWMLDQVLVVPLGLFHLFDGLRVAIEGDTILIGDLQDSAVHVFERSAGTWSQTDTLMPVNAGAGVTFGTSVSLVSGRAVIGGSSFFDPIMNSGTAWVFERQGGAFVEVQQLITLGAAVSDNAGRVLDQTADTIVLGASTHDLGDPVLLQSAGAAFVFELQGATWVQTALLSAPAPSAGDGFGHAVTLQGDTLLIGAPARDDSGMNSGALYRYARTPSGWQWTHTIQPSLPANSSAFGRSLDLLGDTLVVGTAGNLPGSGVAILRGVQGLDDWVPSVATSLAGTSGQSPCSFGSHVPMLSQPASLTMTGALPGAFGYLIAGFTRVNAPFLGGVLVPTPTAFIPVFSDAAGETVFPWTWPAAPLAAPALWTQFWMVDAGAPQGYSATHGMRVALP